MFQASSTTCAGIEDVILGRLVPAGTGLPAYKRLKPLVDDDSPMTSVPERRRLLEPRGTVNQE